MLFTIAFAGINIQFCLPTNITIPKPLSIFFSKENEIADIEYEICLLSYPFQLDCKPIVTFRGMEVYPYKDGWLRLYLPLIEKDGCQVACYTNRQGKNILYYPESKWKFYSQTWNCLHLIGIEEVLLRYEAFLLHSSVVMCNGQMVLFSGPSEIGKSTQASLWEQHLEAEVINGDRCIVRKIEDIFYGCGSPWAGTSGIYRKEMAPIKGIFLLKQAKENTIRKVGAMAFVRLFQQCIVNQWDEAFVKTLTDLLAELLQQVPVYELSCRPDKEAVLLAYDTLFKGGV